MRAEIVQRFKAYCNKCGKTTEHELWHFSASIGFKYSQIICAVCKVSSISIENHIKVIFE